MILTRSQGTMKNSNGFRSKMINEFRGTDLMTFHAPYWQTRFMHNTYVMYDISKFSSFRYQNG